MADKTAWDKADALVRILATILIPVILFFGGRWLDNHQQNANRATTLLKSLTSDSERERRGAVRIATFFANQHELPKELLPVLEDVALNDPDSAVAAQAGETVDVAARTDSLAQGAANDIASAGPHVYIEVSNESTRMLAQRLAAALPDGFVVPGIQHAEFAIRQTQVRFFHETDRPVAQNVAAAMKGLGIAAPRIEQVTGYPHARLRQVEVWLASTDLP